MENEYLTNNLKLEAQAFDKRISDRTENGFIPDIKHYKDNDYFYKSFWRRKKYVDLYIGEMASNYKKTFQKLLNSDSKILDFGCGSGYFSLELARLGFDVIGYDISEDCIKTASNYLRKLDKNLIKGNLEYVNNLEEIKQNHFDGILCSGVLHHIKDLNKTISLLKSFYKEKKSAVLVFHEPCHKKWKKSDAFFVAVVRSLLNELSLWYEKEEKFSNEDEIKDLMDNIHSEYVYERDKSEVEGQSPNDLSSDFEEISSILNKNFLEFKTWPSRSFIYRLLGGIRSTPEKENRIAEMLEIIDSFGVKNGFLNPNYMYGYVKGVDTNLIC